MFKLLHNIFYYKHVTQQKKNIIVLMTDNQQ